MDIEYQKKEVTWCLDRDGPRICLRAVAINNELQHLQISSESFSLDLKTNEAQEFLIILKNLATSKEPAITLNEISPDIVKEISDEIFDEVPAEIPVISPSQVKDSGKSTPSLDNSEILDVLEQSEVSIDNKVDETPVISTPSPESTESLKPSLTLDTSEILDVLKQSEVSIDNKVDETPIISSPSPESTESLKPSLTLDTSEILDVLKQSEVSIDNKVDETPVISTPPPESTELLKPSLTLDTSEILDVLKQSEVQEKEESVKIRRLGSLFGMEEQVTLTPSRDTSKISEIIKQTDGELENELTQLTDILIGKEEPSKDSYESPEVKVKAKKLIEGISSEENVKPTEVLSGRVDTASFFQKTDEKSPLEQLLDDDTEELKSDSLISPSDTDELSTSGEDSFEDKKLIDSKEIAPFTPSDLQSSSFISDFKSKKIEKESETSRIESQERSPHPSKDNSRQLDLTTDKSYTTEAERRNQIEKEREARKKRLWELTRGF